MQTVSLELAQAQLPKLLHELGLHEQLVILEGDQPLATVTKSSPAAPRRRIFGRCRGMFKYADGWDGPEEDFRFYRERLW